MSSAEKRLQIALITVTDARNRHSWSGTNHYIWKSLQNNIADVTLIFSALPLLPTLYLRTLNTVSLLIFRKRIDWRHSGLLSRLYARRIEQELLKNTFDLIIAPAAELIISELTTKIPIIYINDRTVAGSLYYHKIFQNLWRFSLEQSITMDRRAIEKSLFTVYPSNWAAASAINDYHFAPEKIKTIPFGANIDNVPSRSIAENRKLTKKCKLLFIGVNWNDKGGPIALSCLKELLRMGIDAELTVVGTKAPEGVTHPSMKVIPFLNKNKEEEFRQLQQLWIKSTFLILPTRIDAFGIVFCEASAFGLPSLGTDTGGVAGALHNGKNGYLMPMEAEGKDYAEKIRQIISEAGAYEKLAISSREEFEKHLNWDSWAISLKKVIEEKLN